MSLDSESTLVNYLLIFQNFCDTKMFEHEIVIGSVTKLDTDSPKFRGTLGPECPLGAAPRRPKKVWSQNFGGCQNGRTKPSAPQCGLYYTI